MYTNTLRSAALALAAAQLAATQTFTECDPTKKSCPPDPAFGKGPWDCDWTGGGKCDILETYPRTTVSHEEQGLKVSIDKDGQAPTLGSKKTIFFGKVDVELQAAPGQGIVTSLVLESANLDEVDWEWVGGDNFNVQTNYFGKGDTTTYDRAAMHPVSNPLKETHKYTIEWTSEFITWSVDGNEVRRLNYEDAQGGARFPQTPMEVKIGTWVAGGKDSEEGTRKWAGGYTDFSQAPFVAYYKSLSIVDYAGGDAPTNKEIKEYTWSDRTGSFESIKAVEGEGSSDSKDDKRSEDEEEDEEEKLGDISDHNGRKQPKEDVEKDDDDEDDEDSTATGTHTSDPTDTKLSPTDATATVTADEDEVSSSMSMVTESATAPQPPSNATSAMPTGTGADAAPDADAAAGVLASMGGVMVAGLIAVAVAQIA